VQYLSVNVEKSNSKRNKDIRMKKLVKILGIIAIAAAIGFTMAGCGDEDFTYTFVNNSSHAVTVTSSGLTPSNFTIPVGSTRTAQGNGLYVEIFYTPAASVNMHLGGGGFHVTFINR
jgi:hypothetical protein